MPIQYDQKEQVFMLQTPKTSYVLGVYEGKYLLHLYYGKRIERYTAMQHRLPTHGINGFSATDVEESRYSTNVLPMEFPCLSCRIRGWQCGYQAALPGLSYRKRKKTALRPAGDLCRKRVRGRYLGDYLKRRGDRAGCDSILYGV